MSIRNDFARVVNSFLAMGSTRAKLFALELADEKQRWLNVIVLAIVVLLFAMLGLIMASVAITLFFWDTEYRWWGMFGVTIFHFVVAFIAYFCLQAKRKAGGVPFAKTRETLCEDIQRFSQSNEPVSTSTAVVVVEPIAPSIRPTERGDIG